MIVVPMTQMNLHVYMHIVIYQASFSLHCAMYICTRCFLEPVRRAHDLGSTWHVNYTNCRYAKGKEDSSFGAYEDERSPAMG